MDRQSLLVSMKGGPTVTVGEYEGGPTVTVGEYEWWTDSHCW